MIRSILATLAIVAAAIVATAHPSTATRVTVSYHGYPVTCTQTVDQYGNGWLNNCSLGR